jgi:cytosolic carboxypeptidase protein 2/3
MSSLHNRQDRDAPPFSDAKSGKTLTSRASILDRHTLPYPPLVASPPTSFSGRGAQELHDMGMLDARRTMYKESSSMLPASVLSQKPSSALASTRAGAPRNAQNDKRDVFVRDRDSDASHLYPKKPVSASSASRTVSASESTKSVVREASVAAEEAKSSSSANDKLDEAVSRIIKTLRLKSSTISGFPASKLEGIISVNSNPMSPNAFNSTSNYSDQFNSRSEPLFIQDIERQARAEASSKYLPTPLERHFDGSSPGRLLAKSSSKAEDLDSVKVSFAFAAHALRLANAKRLASASSRLDAAAASKFGASDAEPQVYSGSASNSEINGSQKSESDSSEDDEMPSRSALEESSGAKIASAQLSIKTQAQKSRFSQMPQPLPLFSERCPDVPLSAAETGAYATLERPDHVDKSPPREPFDESNSAEKIQQRYEVFCASKHQAYNEIPDRSNLVFDANVMIRDQSVFFDPEDYGCTKPIPSLTFSGKFESGNLRRAFRVGCYEYNLFLSYDVLTQGHTQWYYFRTSGMQKGVKYTFHIVNLLKKKSLYQKGLMPLLYSDKTAAQTGIGWYRAGVPLAYGMNKMKRKAKKNFVTFTFSMQFPFTDDTCYIAHCYPYRYSDLLRHLGEFEKEDAGRFLRKRVMCDTIGGNEVHLLTITDRTTPDLNSKPVVLLTARVHPGETNASWMMLGTLKYLLSPEASALRRAYVFKVVPMLNVDGVVVGNYRCSLSGHDLNRRYHNPDPRKHSEIYMLKKVVQGIKETQSIVLYIDYHGHSCKPGFFFYGCDHSFVKSKSGPLHHRPEEEKVFPWLVQQNADAFVYKDCSFSIKKSKETTGR